MTNVTSITVIAGGVGAARMLAGLSLAAPPESITAIVNTGDDTRLHGLHISPDLDTCTYTLAGAINTETGWGLTGETWSAMDALKRYQAVTPADSGAAVTWFGLGDRDLATHLYRTHRIGEGAPLSTVTAEITKAWGLGVRLIPMTDDDVRTKVTVAGEGEVDFQTYFVRHHHAVSVSSVRFAAAESSKPAPGVLAAIHEADIIVVAPSNPIVSIGPVLAVPGIRDALIKRRDDVVAVSPIIAGAALKGPADRMLVELGHEASVLGVTRLYREFASTLVVDDADAASEPAIEALGMRCVVTPTIMRTPELAKALGQTTLAAV
ncbi:MAG: 2-phospho-L-lactate transferase [Acidimicrobiia bacterium]